MKNQHNRSVNVTTDSPRSKKRKINKGRVSPNTLAINHQRHPSALVEGMNPKNNSSLEAELALLRKGRPRSAKLKKKYKNGEKGK